MTVGMIEMPPSTYTDVAEETQPLVLDETRLDELDEAWLPVVSADGPACPGGSRTIPATRCGHA